MSISYHDFLLPRSQNRIPQDRSAFYTPRCVLHSVGYVYAWSHHGIEEHWQVDAEALHERKKKRKKYRYEKNGVYNRVLKHKRVIIKHSKYKIRARYVPESGWVHVRKWLCKTAANWLRTEPENCWRCGCITAAGIMVWSPICSISTLFPLSLERVASSLLPWASTECCWCSLISSVAILPR